MIYLAYTYLDKMVHAQGLGFTNTLYNYVEADEPDEAEKKVTNFLKPKFEYGEKILKMEIQKAICQTADIYLWLIK